MLYSCCMTRLILAIYWPIVPKTMTGELQSGSSRGEETLMRVGNIAPDQHRRKGWLRERKGESIDSTRQRGRVRDRHTERERERERQV